MRLLYDDFAFFCAPEFLANSLDVVLSRLEDRRTRGKAHVDLLPLPTGSRDLQRLKRVFRHDVYQRFYAGDPATLPYLEDVRPKLKTNPRWFEDQLAAIARRLETRVPYVYGSRDKDVAWEGTPTPEPADAAAAAPPPTVPGKADTAR